MTKSRGCEHGQTAPSTSIRAETELFILAPRHNDSKQPSKQHTTPQKASAVLHMHSLTHLHTLRQVRMELDLAVPRSASQRASKCIHMQDLGHVQAMPLLIADLAPTRPQFETPVGHNGCAGRWLVGALWPLPRRKRNITFQRLLLLHPASRSQTRIVNRYFFLFYCAVLSTYLKLVCNN
ncbi:hypothetical protein BD289DRAFT_246706 [Coniella lustricola]|uniref:Uncharacterized protein n=1 Tax=Coniella lustricola TaxID=2025994 RepID=A0A2T3A915_9PEZI|nr:hypothetical protein BD289DRAFT_246706 [Coniella lustricola]